MHRVLHKTYVSNCNLIEENTLHLHLTSHEKGLNITFGDIFQLIVDKDCIFRCLSLSFFSVFNNTYNLLYFLLAEDTVCLLVSSFVFFVRGIEKRQ